MGSTGLDVETRVQASTGYVLARDAWGLGYATELASEMVRLADVAGTLRLTRRERWSPRWRHRALGRRSGPCGRVSR